MASRLAELVEFYDRKKICISGTPTRIELNGQEKSTSKMQRK